MIALETATSTQSKSTSATPAGPCTLVIFGASGDLTHRKLIPALYNLASGGLLPKQFAVVGVGRSPLAQDDFRQKLRQGVDSFATDAVENEIWGQIEAGLHYLSGNFQDPETYQNLRTLLTQLDQDRETRGNYLFYLATAPQFFAEIIQHLGGAGLTQEADSQWRRVIIEKPFGQDLASAKALNKEITQVLNECQIYRIDHYLGKETVQNILVFRFGNGMFEPIWNHRYIDHVQITVAEQVGVESRGGYYEGSGALRDMVQNHLFQLLAMVTMEPPVSFEADAVRDEKSKVLRAIVPLSEEDVLTNAVRGQYGEGLNDDETLAAYRSEPRVDPASKTETFVALKLNIDNWRWAGVPFYLRTGKRLANRVSEIAIQFKQPPSLLFRQTAADQFTPNFLTLRIQPNEGISLQFGAKVPGPNVQMGAVDMDFCYANYFRSAPSTGYETLLYDCMIGDATLFQRSDNVELGWQVVTPILDVWQSLPVRNFPNYAAGSWGPQAADDLLTREGRQWRVINSQFCRV